MDDVRWRGASGSARTVITWPEGKRPRDGASSPSLSKEQALMFLKGIAEGREPIAMAEFYGIESFDVSYSRSTLSQTGRRTKKPRWCVHILVGLCPNRDADYFRKPLEGLPPESFRGL
ncbi:hypothetical protein DLM45_01590 [Hyphomicrobium methylovorum]|uniref:hypothetical protein n=1 Tax=Hyphomicrobium methylovorum TaxID=84 RepID=UPI0015E70371|nr:hypothetical protein [Hyphomicrobium methylovorum]MBA2124918.1 hypothetical protein [Hyphomicrobium methylovorum]